jgi:mono/diheme cytochrome c family protein
MRAARALFERRCQRCHGDDGKGSSVRDQSPEVPNFTRGRWQASHSDAQLQASILDGAGSQMPAFRGVISEEQADDLVARVRAFGPAGPGAGRASADDFDSRMRKLDEELKELQRQFRELSRPLQKP